MGVKTNGSSVNWRLGWIVVVILGALALLSLAAWQWQRASAKEDWLSQQASAANTRVEWRNSESAERWRSGHYVKLSGRFDPHCRVALDNQPKEPG